MGFLLEQCTLKALDEDILNSCEKFSCGEKDLDDFFYHDSIGYKKQLIGKSYCFVMDSNPNVIACAFTVSNDSIKTEYLPNSRVKMVRKNIPREKHMGSYPAVLIGRLGVNCKLERKGIGTELMDFVKGWFVEPNNKTGCRFLIVDSYNNAKAIRYYEKNGFKLMFSSQEQEKERLRLDLNSELKTRFMFFDLIVLSTGN